MEHFFGYGTIFLLLEQLKNYSAIINLFQQQVGHTCGPVLDTKQGTLGRGLAGLL